jgi:hypothetical protein
LKHVGFEVLHYEGRAVRVEKKEHWILLALGLFTVFIYQLLLCPLLHISTSPV